MKHCRNFLGTFFVAVLCACGPTTEKADSPKPGAMTSASAPSAAAPARPMSATAAPASTASAPDAAPETIQVPAGDKTVYIHLTRFKGYTHSRPRRVAIEFPLYEGKRWIETATGGRHSWDVEFTVTTIANVSLEGELLRVARIKIFTAESPRHERRHDPEFNGECLYSPAKEKIVRCSG